MVGCMLKACSVFESLKSINGGKEHSFHTGTTAGGLLEPVNFHAYTCQLVWSEWAEEVSIFARSVKALHACMGMMSPDVGILRGK